MIRVTLLVVLIAFSFPSAAQPINDLDQDLKQIQSEITKAVKEYEKYKGGLIKTLIAMRIETLKLTESLLVQRRIAIREGAKFDFKVPATKPDPEKAAEIEQDLIAAMEELRKAEKNAGRYSGGLVRALALSTVATQQQTVAMLKQAALAARYGLAVPAARPSKGREAISGSLVRKTKDGSQSGTDVSRPSAKDCLKIADYGSTTLDTNRSFSEIAWKVDISNRCDRAFRVRVRFTLQDEAEYELDDDRKTIIVPKNGVGKARGKMLVSPPSKAARVKFMGVSYTVLK